MRKRRTSKRIEAWIKENQQAMSADAIDAGPGDEVTNTQSPQGVLAFEDKIEGPVFNADHILTKCDKMDYNELCFQYKVLTMTSDVNEELIYKSDQLNIQQDRISEEVMEQNEIVQNERIEVQNKLKEEMKSHTRFKREAEYVEKKHRCNVVESQIIDLFHENIKPEIRELVTEIDECREKLKLSAKATDANVEKIRKETDALINENCNNFELLASMRKELNALKIGLLGDESEVEDEDDNCNDTDDYVVDEGYTEGNGNVTEKYSCDTDTVQAINRMGKTDVKSNIDFHNLLLPERKPQAGRSISPETDKALRSIEVNDVDIVRKENADVASVKDKRKYPNELEISEKIHEAPISDVSLEMSSRNDIMQSKSCQQHNLVDFSDGEMVNINSRKKCGVEANSSLDSRGRPRTKIPKPTKKNSRSASRSDARMTSSEHKPQKLLPRDYYTRKASVKAATRTQSVGKIKDENNKEHQKNNESVDSKYNRKNKRASKTDDIRTIGQVKDTKKTKSNTDSCTADKSSPRKLPPIISTVKSDTKISNVTKLPPITPRQNKTVSKSRKSVLERNPPTTTLANTSVTKPKRLPKKEESLDMKIGTDKSVQEKTALNPKRKMEHMGQKTIARKNLLPPVKVHEKVSRKCAQMSSICITEALPPINKPAVPKLNKEKTVSSLPWVHSNKYNDLTPRDTTVRTSADETDRTSESAEIVNIIGQAKAFSKRKR